MIRNLRDNAHNLRSELYIRNGLVSFLGAPFSAQGEPAGVFSVFTREPHDFTEEEIDFVEFLAVQAGSAVSHGRLSTQNVQFSDELLRKENEIRKLLAGLMNAQDEEARRIARVLHDESGQILASVYISLDETAKQLPDSAKAQIETVKSRLDRVEDCLRDLSHELYPAVLENLGLVAGLECLAEQISKRRAVRIAVESHLTARLSPRLELTLYRVIQEALNNATRHSQASKAQVRLLENSSSIYCFIRDNGVGFDVDAAMRAAPAKMLTMGLSGMAQRVAAVDGVLEIQSTPGEGTDITLRIPKSYS
jgi:signal transduction histidine kinase